MGKPSINGMCTSCIVKCILCILLCYSSSPKELFQTVASGLVAALDNSLIFYNTYCKQRDEIDNAQFCSELKGASLPMFRETFTISVEERSVMVVVVMVLVDTLCRCECVCGCVM